MKEVDELAEAFQNIHKYENYRVLRSWGIMVIIFGISAAISDTRWFLGIFIRNLFQIEQTFVNLSLGIIRVKSQ